MPEPTELFSDPMPTEGNELPDPLDPWDNTPFDDVLFPELSDNPPPEDFSSSEN